MSNIFNSVQMRKPSQNSFDLSHDFKFSMDQGVLTPVLLQEVIPGDRFSISSETLVRFAPMVTPVMHNFRVFTHYFFVPNRIVCQDKLWQDFISADLSKDVPPVWPYVVIHPNMTDPGSLADYLGIPKLNSGTIDVSAIPFAAYQLVFNEYYRDQNLQNDFNSELEEGENPTNTGLLTLRKRAWQHDYFTAALPFAQKGPAVSLPLTSQSVLEVYSNKDDLPDPTSTWASDSGSISVKNIPHIGDPADFLYADLNANAATINDLRVAMRLQEWFEKAARGGSRYIEQLQVHFGVRSSDQRMNRPEFLGGSINPVIISEVLQTSSTDEVSPQGDMAGHGISVGSGKNVRYYAEEHGYIIGIQSILPSTAYMQGLPRHFSRQSWQDYAWPTFAHLGEQEILNKELYLDPSDGLDDETFGYIPRYSEYRYSPSRVSGEFRTTLSDWHDARIFANRPHLNAEFIECVPRSDYFAVQDNSQKMWCHVFHKCFVNRKLPKYGTPAL